jgi:integrase
MWRALVDPGGDILDDAGPASGWAPRTQAKKVQNYGYWLNFIRLRFPELSCRAPCDRITPRTVAAWLELMARLVAPYTRLMRLVDLMTIATGAASDRDWNFLRRAVARLARAVSPVKDKASRVRSTAALVELGLKLMRDAEQMPVRPSRWREILYRDGLIIAVLALRPIRLRNLTELELGVTLIDAGVGHRMVFPANQVKTRRPLEIDWPPELETALRVYLERHRPLLLRNGRTASLWISSFGTALAAHTIQQAIIGRTLAGLGVAINPHLFRDCAATTVAIGDPAHVGIASCLLGHASTATTDRFYNQASSIVASRAYRSVLTHQRAILRPLRR